MMKWTILMQVPCSDGSPPPPPGHELTAGVDSGGRIHSHLCSYKTHLNTSFYVSIRFRSTSNYVGTSWKYSKTGLRRNPQPPPSVAVSPSLCTYEGQGAQCLWVWSKRALNHRSGSGQ